MTAEADDDLLHTLRTRWRILSAIRYQQALARGDKAECHRLVVEHQRLATADLLVLKSKDKENET